MIILPLAIMFGLVPFFAGVGYRLFIVPYVRAHFGEESRRDIAARIRRQTFERRCVGSMVACYFCGAFGVVRGIVTVLAPDLAPWALGIQIVLAIVVVLLGCAAGIRWHEPFRE